MRCLFVAAVAVVLFMFFLEESANIKKIANERFSLPPPLYRGGRNATISYLNHPVFWKNFRRKSMERM